MAFRGCVAFSLTSRGYYGERPEMNRRDLLLSAMGTSGRPSDRFHVLAEQA